MSKLLMAFVHHDDIPTLSDALRTAGHRFTEVPSVGGFLAVSNATFVLAVEDQDEAAVIEIFETACRARDVEVPLVLTERLADWQARTVAHGSATILIADLQRIVRV